MRLSCALVEAVLKKLARGKEGPGNWFELHTTVPQFQTTLTRLYPKVSGTMRSLAGRCYHVLLKRVSVSIAGAAACVLVRFGRTGSGPDRDLASELISHVTSESLSTVVLVPFIAYASLF